MPLAEEPVPKLRDFFGALRGELDFVSQARFRVLLRNASSAIFQGLRGLLEDDRRRILLPAYHCGEEVEAVVRAGGEPVFYRVDADCRPDLDDLASRLSGETLAIFVAHYNGFPQPIEAICELARTRGVHVIEDCAHVLRSERAGRRLGEFGAFAAFSLRKYLPAITGGLLAVNDVRLADALASSPQAAPSALSDAGRLAMRWWRARRPPLPTLREAPTPAARPVPEFGREDLTQAISALSRRVLERTDLAQVVEIRRRHYLALEADLGDTRGIRRLQAPLPDGVCPLWFLAEVEDPWHLRHALAERGVGSIVFWSHFHPRFPAGAHPEAEALKSRVIALPVHQGLSDEDVQHIGRSVTECL